MRSSGNSRMEVCIDNLLKISRGEVPYERLKGVSFSQMDGPVTTAGQDIVEDAEWMLNVYEPRAKVESIDLIPIDAQNGQFEIKANISTIIHPAQVGCLPRMQGWSNIWTSINVI